MQDSETGKTTVLPYRTGTDEASAPAGKEQTGNEESDSSANPSPAGRVLGAEVATEKLAREDESSSLAELGAGEDAVAAANGQNEDGSEPPGRVCSGQHDHANKVEGADA